jgi:hypothetical protein
MIKIFRESVFPVKTHQHGWNAVLKLMRTHFHQQTGAPAFLDDFVDISFGSNSSDPGLPYRHPWVGIIHHPVKIPVADPVLALLGAGTMMHTSLFRESVKHCKALITFSLSNAREIRKVLDEIGAIVPVFSVAHPTDQNVPLFSFEVFAQKTREINAVGFWLRRLQTFAELRTDLKKRYIFMSHRVDERVAHLRKCTAGLPQNFKIVPYLDHEDYNHALATGIGFADYYAVCASNTIIEHIARGTPLLVNPEPSVIDYLGKEYPFYFTDLKEAEDKLRDMKLIQATHEYLKSPKYAAMLSYDYFIQGMRTILTKVLA